MNGHPLKSKEGYKVLFDNAPDAVIVIDIENKISFWNTKAEEVFGWLSDEVMGQDISEIIIPESYRAAHKQGMQRYVTTGEIRVLNKTIEVPALHKEGKEFFISLTISRTTLQGNTSFLAFIRDITEQKKNISELEQKTIELERSNANLEEFAYAASHDLQEPVRKVYFFADRLKNQLSGRLKQDELKMFERMENATQRMQILIDDLLHYSHITRSADLLEEIDLNNNVHSVIGDLDMAIQEKGAMVTVAGLPIIKGNRRQLQQLFQNLISNALKYSKPDVPPMINIYSDLISGNEVPDEKLTSEDKSKKFHLIKVTDNGIGFEQKDAEKIFQMFQRLHGKSEYAGTGIGLSIVKKVVENHHGFITTESKPGLGATFNIYLPVTEEK